MHFDDRLATVLDQPATGDALARIQFRQLVDILGRMPDGTHSQLIEQGFARVRALQSRIDSDDRARLLRQQLQPLSNPRLLTIFAEDDAEVACAAIASARLNDRDWLALVPRLPVRARGILRHRRDLSARVTALLEKLGTADRALPPADAPCEEAATLGESAAPAQATSLTEGAMTQGAEKSADEAAAPVIPTALRQALSASAERLLAARHAEDTAPAPPSPVVSKSDARATPPLPDTAATRRTPAPVQMSEAEIEDMVLTQLLGPEAPADLDLPGRHCQCGDDAGAQEHALRRGTGGNQPPAPPAHGPGGDAGSRDADEQRTPTADTPPARPGAAPTSLREWARMKAGSASARHGLSPSGSAMPGNSGQGLTKGGHEGIGAIVRRIEEFRRAREVREDTAGSGDSPRLPLGDALPSGSSGPATIDFTTDPEGRIDWADGPFAPAVIGSSLMAHEIAAREHLDVANSIRARLPVRGSILTLDGAAAISGEWQADAAACFDSHTGQFTGYCGRLRRLAAAPAGEVPHGAHPESDTLRQVLHELRTPANAIQVSAEIIQQQLYGPAPHEYRALAALVAGDCAHILAGFEELDRLVRLETGALVPEAGEADLAAVTHQTMERLSNWTEPRNSGFAPEADLASIHLPVSINQADVERLVWRLVAALAGAAVTGERLGMRFAVLEGMAILEIALPAALAEREGDALFAIGEGMRSQALTAGIFGVGFTLRLAAAEASAGGGALRRNGDCLVLSLPAAASAPDKPEAAAAPL
ncbi:sensor histidine kinase [Novosphingobium sp. YJ-S2-02]|uniref:histidine kinase n=1 Tax=Novosphingobium aureum TaxID=2792964 RepID=A0A931HC37_9SPHN|nr:sensor histidine kinase [Novosphingobium aureum]MBH0112753.1 sensor histidine kinase [Novosphingobium aureum]